MRNWCCVGHRPRSRHVRTQRSASARCSPVVQSRWRARISSRTCIPGSTSSMHSCGRCAQRGLVLVEVTERELLGKTVGSRESEYLPAEGGCQREHRWMDRLGCVKVRIVGAPVEVLSWKMRGPVVAQNGGTKQILPRTRWRSAGRNLVALWLSMSSWSSQIMHARGLWTSSK